MSTKHSPLRKLTAEANRIASILKAAERGDKIDIRFATKIAEARKQEGFKAGIVMDDKVIILTLPWSIVREHTEAELSQYIVDQMREAHDVAN